MGVGVGVVVSDPEGLTPALTLALSGLPINSTMPRHLFEMGREWQS